MNTEEIITRLNDLGYAVRVRHFRRWTYPVPQEQLATKGGMRRRLASDPFVGRGVVEPVLQARGGVTEAAIYRMQPPYTGTPKFDPINDLVSTGVARTWIGDNYNKREGAAMALDRALDGARAVLPETDEYGFGGVTVESQRMTPHTIRRAVYSGTVVH